MSHAELLCIQCTHL